MHMSELWNLLYILPKMFPVKNASKNKLAFIPLIKNCQFLFKRLAITQLLAILQQSFVEKYCTSGR